MDLYGNMIGERVLGVDMAADSRVYGRSTMPSMINNHYRFISKSLVNVSQG